MFSFLAKELYAREISLQQQGVILTHNTALINHLFTFINESAMWSNINKKLLNGVF